MSFQAFVSSIEGPYHRKSGSPNQDSAHWLYEEDFFIGAVADGAGSLKFSDIGSETATHSAVNAMHKALFSSKLKELPSIGVEAGRKAQLAHEGYKEYGSTLTVVVLKSSGEWAAGGVGDSFGVIHKSDESHELVTGTPIGEYANITQLLTSKTIKPIYSSGIGATGFSLSSDGLESVAISKRQAHPGFWNGIRDKALDGSLDVSRLFDWLASLDRIVDDTTLLTVVKG